MKKIVFSIFALALAFVTPAMAQEEENEYEYAPYMFVGVQGGVQNTFNKEFNNWKTFTPTASLSFGGYFNPVVGARLHFNGIWDKSGVDHCIDLPDAHYNYNYMTTSADVLVNLCTLFGKKSHYPVNLIFVGGLGFNYAWECRGRCEDEAAKDYVNGMIYADNDHRWAFNGRTGLILDVPVCKNLSINLEGDVNHIVPGSSKRFNTDHLQFLGQLGLNFKFGYKKPKVEPVVEEPQPAPEVWETRIDTIWYDDVQYKDVAKDREFKKEIFFGLAQDGVNQDQEQIKAAAEFLKGVKDGEITITAYADKGTGTPKMNMKYSKQRAEKTKQALVDNGVDASMIKSIVWKGDTEQPYADNDKNRLSVITGHGVYTDKEKETVRKFRTETKRVRVQ